MAKNIISLPENDRPYEKLEKLGSENLTNSELLAIIIKTGTKEKNCLDISRELLRSSEASGKNELENLSQMSINELTKFSGIGKVKAIQIKAAIELARRIYEEKNSAKKKISCPKDAYNLVNSYYFGLNTEMFSVIMLDKACNVIGIKRITEGSSSKVDLGVKEVFSEPIKNMASSVILVHNHPSGSLVPSRQDIRFTKLMEEYGTTFGIKVSDHVIIGKDEYISMKEEMYF